MENRTDPYPAPVEPALWCEPAFHTDHDFSFAVVGDPQRISLGDYYQGTKKMKQLFGYIADTAGFSLLDFERFDFFTLEDLPHTLREFAPYLGKCRYTDCTHINDEECAILDAVQAGDIPRTRHEAYKELYATLKEKKKYK